MKMEKPQEEPQEEPREELRADFLESQNQSLNY